MVRTPLTWQKCVVCHKRFPRRKIIRRQRTTATANGQEIRGLTAKTCGRECSGIYVHQKNKCKCGNQKMITSKLCRKCAKEEREK